MYSRQTTLSGNRSRLANRNRYIKRSAYLMKNRASAMLTNRSGLTSGQVKTRLTTGLTYTSTGSGVINQYQGIVAACKTSQDWDLYASLYSYFTITKVKVQIFVGPTSTNTEVPGIMPQVTICYDSATNGIALANQQQALNMNNYKVISGQSVGKNATNTENFFKFRPICSQQPPVCTLNDNEVWGFLKTITSADWVGTGPSFNAIIYIISFNFIFDGNI